jgi:hypothetical protein
MSNKRRTRRPPARPPARLQELARQSECPDCNSEVVLLHRRGGDEWDWVAEVRHDSDCPQLAWRERTGAGPSIALVSRDGSPLPPEAAAKVMTLLAGQGLIPGRVVATGGSMPPAPGWEEREQIERAVNRLRRSP